MVKRVWLYGFRVAKGFDASAAVGGADRVLANLGGSLYSWLAHRRFLDKWCTCRLVKVLCC